MIKIAQVNVRYSEGGAAQVARTIHQGLDKARFSSVFCYGYSKGGRPSIQAQSDRSAIQITQQGEALASLIFNRMLGFAPEFITNHANQKIRSIASEVDIVHLHAIHSYFLSTPDLLAELVKSKKRVVWTLHDHWTVTGRCAFLDGCGSWNTGCGTCPSGNNYPPSYLDFSKKQFRIKTNLITEMLATCKFISPSRHLARDFLSIYPNADLEIIPNSIDQEIENAEASKDFDKPSLHLSKTLASPNLKVLVIAHDLSYQGKTNHRLINAILVDQNIELITVGKNSPFTGANVKNLGEIRSRVHLTEIFKQADCMLFTSSVDNFPLVCCEALYCGLPVIATSSAASNEVLDYVSANTASEEEILARLRARRLSDLYPECETRESISASSRSHFSSRSMIEKYAKVYAN